MKDKKFLTEMMYAKDIDLVNPDYQREFIIALGDNIEYILGYCSNITKEQQTVIDTFVQKLKEFKEERLFVQLFNYVFENKENKLQKYFDTFTDLNNFFTFVDFYEKYSKKEYVGEFFESVFLKNYPILQKKELLNLENINDFKYKYWLLNHVELLVLCEPEYFQSDTYQKIVFSVEHKTNSVYFDKKEFPVEFSKIWDNPKVAENIAYLIDHSEELFVKIRLTKRDIMYVFEDPDKLKRILSTLGNTDTFRILAFTPLANDSRYKQYNFSDMKAELLKILDY